MTDYKSIFGKPVKYLSTDPTDTGAEGQIWYNSTAGAYKSVLVGSAWVSGAPLTTSRFQGGMVGTQTSALIVGSENPTSGNLGTVEEYNGSGWISSPSINTARQGIGSTGTTSAAIAMGGLISGPNVRQTLSEEWNGTAWTAGNALTEAGRANISGAAAETAAVAMFSGELTPDSNSGKYHEQYNGTSWTASTKCPTVRVQGSYAGSQTAGIGFGGRANSPGAPSVRNKTSDIWNGTTWTSGPSGVTERSGHSSHGTDSSAIFCRGVTNPGSTYLTSTEEYDGTSFSATPSVTNTGQGFAGGHAQPSPVGAAWITGGNSVQTATEEFNRSASVITPGAWAAGGSMNTARASLGGTGTQTATVAFAGGVPPGLTASTASEEYNGSAWTSGNPILSARRTVGGAGTQTAALFTGGFGPGPGNSNFTNTEEYDGTSWTAGGAYPFAGHGIGLFGTQTATASIGGGLTGPSTTSNEYNGTAWTATNAANVGRFNGLGGGTQSAGVFAGCDPSLGPGGSATEHYDGTSWTTSGNTNVTRADVQGSNGTQTASQISGGRGPAGTLVASENYDGSTWSTNASLATARTFIANSGVQTAGLAFGGAPTPTVPPNAIANTEEFTGETSALNFKTLTTS